MDNLNEVIVFPEKKVGWMIEKINDLYKQGNIKGIVLAIHTNDGEMIMGISEGLDHIEKLGLASQLEEDIKNQARVIYE